MTRRLLSLLTILSLLLSLASAALWARSYFVAHRLSAWGPAREGRSWTASVESDCGSLELALTRVDYDPLDDAAYALAARGPDRHGGPGFAHEASRAVLPPEPSTGPLPSRLVWFRADRRGHTHWLVGPGSELFLVGAVWRRVMVPGWVPAAAFALAPAAWAVRRARLRRRRSRGLCPRCAYDLRATPGRCPECGAAARAAPDAPAGVARGEPPAAR